MAARKPFLLRADPDVLAALQRWAGDELRSVNGQIEFILRRALQRAGRLPNRETEAPAEGTAAGDSPVRRPPDGAADGPEEVDS